MNRDVTTITTADIKAELRSYSPFHAPKCSTIVIANAIRGDKR
jgi:hypothetical protein